MIAEVNNTFGDCHSYLCHHDDWRALGPDDALQARKIFHVSPFQPVEGHYRFRFGIRHHLVGPLLCQGVNCGPTGRVTSRYVAEMQGHWQGYRGILDERFRYAGGETQQRQWSLTLGNDGAISAEADDLQGPDRGQQAGAGLRLRYRIRPPDHAGGWVLDVTDWMYLMENGTIINRGRFRKLGF